MTGWELAGVIGATAVTVAGLGVLVWLAWVNRNGPTG